MAAAPPNDYSLLLGDPSLWADPDPDLVAILTTNVAVNGPAHGQLLVNLSARAPITTAFVLDSDPDVIYVGHSLSMYPANPSSPTPFDNTLVTLVGRYDNAAFPVIFPAGALLRLNAARAGTMDLAHGVTGLTHPTGPTRLGPHAGGAPDTAELRTRSVFPLPPSLSALAVRDNPTGRYSPRGFFDVILQPYLTGSAGQQAAIAPLGEWFRVACTLAGAGADPATQFASTMPANPLEQRQLDSWTHGLRTTAMAKIGVGTGGITGATFAAGLATLRTTLEDQTTRALDVYQASSTTTFAEKHGNALADRVLNLCNVNNANALPEVHQTLVSCPKARECGVVTALFAERAEATPLPVSTANAPLATTSLVNDLFRTYMPGGTGLTFGKGLTPFAIVCEGHKDAEAAKATARKAALVEAGSSTSLSDASSFTTNDVRFPSEVYIAVEKLCGWSVVIDVFHGVGHNISTSIRAAVNELGPCLQRLVTHMSDNPRVGMDLVCRVLFELQQDYFAWLTTAASQPTTAVPSFTDIRRKVLTYRADSLSPLPIGWYSMIGAPSAERRFATARSPTREGAGTVATFNAEADNRLLSRFRDSTHSSIGSSVQNHENDIPTHAGNPVCLTWALKGQCSASCKRKDQHVRYPRTVNQALHRFLDTCGVTNNQA